VIVADAHQGFRYDLELLVNDQPVDFHISWRCHSKLEGPNFGPGGPILRVQAPTVSERWMVHGLPNGAVVISPLRMFCQDAFDADGTPDGGEYNFASILLIDNPNHPSSLQIFSKKEAIGLGYTVRIVKSFMVGLDTPEPDYSLSAENKRLLKSILDSCTGYQRVSAVTFPESVWGKSQALESEFNHLEKATSGPFQGVDQLDFKSALSLSFVKSEGTWTLPPGLPSGPQAEIYFPIDGPRQTSEKMRGDDLSRPPPPTAMSIGGVNIPVGTLNTPVYDPKTRLFMYLINQKYNCWNLR